MFVVSGIYSFFPEAVAFRNDFCLSCEDERLSLQIRSFDVVHIYWIPMIPLGFRKAWACRVCGNSPHDATKTRLGFKKAAVVVAGIGASVSWIAPAAGDESATVWIARLFLTLGFLAAIRWVTHHQPSVSLDEHLSHIEPYSAPSCPLCGNELFSMPERHCPGCGVRQV